MRRNIRRLAPMAVLVASTSAVATETTFDYTGTIVAVPDPSQAFDLTLGSQVSFSATFDLGALIDRSKTFYNIDAVTGEPVALAGLRTVSLFDDPNASFRFTAGAHTLTIGDDPDAGNSTLGVGAQPVAIFQNSTFVGVAYAGAAPDGFFVDVDPIAKALHYFPAAGIGFDFNSANPGYGFLIETNLPDLKVSPVPEPASWSMMLAGFGAMGYAMRRRARVRTNVSFA